MKILIVDNGTNYKTELEELFSDHEITTLPLNSNINTTDQYDLVVLSGGHIFNLQENPNVYAREMEIIKSSTTPILGICLGSEIITLAFDGQISTTDHYERGVLPINIVCDDPIFSNITSPFEVYENHKNIISKLPDDMTPLATSVDGIEIFKHKTKLIYGMQFHPEMFKEIGIKNTLISNLLNIINNKN